MPYSEEYHTYLYKIVYTHFLDMNIITENTKLRANTKVSNCTSMNYTWPIVVAISWWCSFWSKWMNVEGNDWANLSHLLVNSSTSCLLSWWKTFWSLMNGVLFCISACRWSSCLLFVSLGLCYLRSSNHSKVTTILSNTKLW